MHGPGAREDRRFWPSKRNPLATTLHRLCVHKMVRVSFFFLNIQKNEVTPKGLK